MQPRALKSAFLAVLAVVSSASLAQEMPPPKDMVLGRKLFVAFGKQVRDELKVTDAQFKKMQDAFEGAVEVEGDRVMIRMTPDTDLGAMEKKAIEALDEGQKKRLDEVWLNVIGAIASADEKIGKALSLTDDQKKSINAIVEDTATALMDLFSSGGHDEETTKKGRALREKASDKAFLLFTDDQKKTWETLKGKPFKLKPEKP